MLANGDYLTLAGVSPERLGAILYGVPRSGSIWVWQILGDLCPQGGVVHTHEYLTMRPEVPVICTLRDWRDCVASNWRIDRPVGLRQCTRERLFWYASQCHRYSFILRQYVNRRKPLLLRYENSMAAPRAMVRRIADKLGVTITDARAAEILEAHSMERNRVLQLESPADPPWLFSRETLLHPRHVGTGGSGIWREWIAERDWPLLHELLRPLMRHWNYGE